MSLFNILYKLVQFIDIIRVFENYICVDLMCRDPELLPWFNILCECFIVSVVSVVPVVSIVPVVRAVSNSSYLNLLLIYSLFSFSSFLYLFRV